jgi:hypothetical protein
MDPSGVFYWEQEGSSDAGPEGLTGMIPFLFSVSGVTVRFQKCSDDGKKKTD